MFLYISDWPAVGDGGPGCRVVEAADLAVEGEEGRGVGRDPVVGPRREVELPNRLSLFSLREIRTIFSWNKLFEGTPLMRF